MTFDIAPKGLNYLNSSLPMISHGFKGQNPNSNKSYTVIHGNYATYQEY